MCGLVAVINKYHNGYTKDQQDAFSTLLYIDALRGMDSTGVFSVDNQGEVMLAKEASVSLDFLKTKEYDKIMQHAWQRGSALVGHNRKATRGKVTDENAHPFVVDDNIVLVHNGTLFGDHKKHADVEVDSHALAHVIHEQQDVAKALGKIDGAYAVIFYDFTNGELNFIRNEQRPLWWMEADDAWYWASEEGMLDFVASRHKIKLKEGPIEIKPNVLQTYKLRKNGGWDLSHETLEIKKSYTPSTSYQTNHGWNHSHGNHMHMGRHPYATDHDSFSPEYPVLDDPVKEAINESVANAGERLIEFEQKLARTTNRLVTYADWKEKILPAYPHESTVFCEAFDYKAVKGGFWLYCNDCQDRDVILKHFWDTRYCTEERILQMAAGGYIFEITVGTKGFIPQDGGIASLEPNDLGHVVIYSKGAPKLISGGGIETKDAVKH